MSDGHTIILLLSTPPSNLTEMTKISADVLDAWIRETLEALAMPCSAHLAGPAGKQITIVKQRATQV